MSKSLKRWSHPLVSELKLITTKEKGNIFEFLCKQYLRKIKKYETVYLWNEIPEELREELKLPRQDMGIDLIIVEGEEIHSVQSKYRKHQTKSIVPGTNGRVRTNIVPWSDLSTFYSLSDRLGVFTKRIVMTNALSIRRVGNKQPNDVSICRGSFAKLTSSQWMEILELSGQKLSDESEGSSSSGDIQNSSSSQSDSLKEMRRLRLARFSNR